MFKISYLFMLVIGFSAYSESFVKKEDGINVNDKAFPWELVIDRGKIIGCVYDNKFYSLGSVLILESLPRLCELASDRNGIWNHLSESELLLFKENIQTQQKLERESTYIGADPINKEEARLIKYIRRVKEFADKGKS